MPGEPVAEPLAASLGWMVVITVVFAPLAITRYRRRIWEEESCQQVAGAEGARPSA